MVPPLQRFRTFSTVSVKSLTRIPNTVSELAMELATADVTVPTNPACPLPSANSELPIIPTNPACPLPSAKAAVTGVGGWDEPWPPGSS